jgi:hypothetical protein
MSDSTYDLEQVILAIDGSYTGTLGALGVIIANQTNGTQKVQITNFPSPGPISGNVAVNNFPNTYSVTGTFWPTTQPISGSVSLGVNNKTPIMINGVLTSSTTATEQLVCSYTVPAGMTFYLQYVDMSVLFGAPTLTPTLHGYSLLESPAGTTLYHMYSDNQTMNPVGREFSEPIPFSSGSVIRITANPYTTTLRYWVGNFGGYIK